MLQDYLDAGETRLVLDFGGLTYVDSSGLGKMLKGLKRARSAAPGSPLLPNRFSAAAALSLSRLLAPRAV